MDKKRVHERGFPGPFRTQGHLGPPLPPSMVVSPQEDPEYRCSGRVRMRRWLITQVASGRYTGLKWIDKDRSLLRIPWKHGSRSGWSAEDGKLFESWAIQSGKFDPLHPNARKWKANFRCALRSLPDVEEVKNLSHKTGKDAYKIFRFLPEKQRKRSYKSTRTWSQTYTRSGSKSEFDRSDPPPLLRPDLNLLHDRKINPGNLLQSLPHDDHRGFYPLDPPDHRRSPPRFWPPHHPQPTSSMNLCRPPPDAICQSISVDHTPWSIRTQPVITHPPTTLPPPPHPLSLPSGFTAAPFSELPCDQYPMSFSNSPLAADPPVTVPVPFRSAAALLPEMYAAGDAYAAVPGEYCEMPVYPPPFMPEFHPQQEEMTDILNLSGLPWSNGLENFTPEVSEVLQVLRDRCGLAGNEIPFGEGLEQFDTKPIH